MPDAYRFARRTSLRLAKTKLLNTIYMKAIRILTLTACVALILPAPPSLAAEHEKAAHAIQVPETTEGILAEIHKHHGEITETIKAKSLKTVHEHSEAITALANSLPAKVVADKKTRVEGIVRNIVKVADALHDAADTGDQAKTEGQLKKLDAVLAQLDSQLK